MLVKATFLKLQPKCSIGKERFSISFFDFARKVEGRHSKYWDEYRKDVLDKQELRTYVLMDSIGEEIKLDKILKWAPSLAKWRIPLKYVDIDLKRIYNYNTYEGSRLGLGLFTNDDIFKNVSIGGYTGYGFKDHTWKYGGDLSIDVPGKKDISINLKYVNDLRETGNLLW